jgi:crotonobetainyl-CoA:carnitine CoA-transferase CaiB-like acyl-CoA transferase
VPGPLAGVRLLDFSSTFSGPFCTLQLADLGADVVNIETDRYLTARSAFRFSSTPVADPGDMRLPDRIDDSARPDR